MMDCSVHQPKVWGCANGKQMTIFSKDFGEFSKTLLFFVCGFVGSNLSPDTSLGNEMSGSTTIDYNVHNAYIVSRAPLHASQSNSCSPRRPYSVAHIALFYISSC
jgi:hypothetical protein